MTDMLEAAVHVTFFQDYAAALKREEQLAPAELAQRIHEMVAGEKARLPWLKLARFGDIRSKLNSLRHDGNVLAITGIEADYDGEEISFDTAVEIVEKAGLAAIVYTSPSHTPDKPRWRVLCPTSEALPPTERPRLLARLNGLYGGIFAAESFVLSQSYYYGRDASNDAAEHRVEVVGGETIDTLDELDAIALYKSKSNGSAPHEPEDKTPTDPQADVFDVFAALSVIPNESKPGWEEWNRIALAICGATGGSEAGGVAFDTWSRKNGAYDAVLTRERWDHVVLHPPSRIGAGTLFHMAAEARPGWRKPSAVFVVPRTGDPFVDYGNGHAPGAQPRSDQDKGEDFEALSPENGQSQGRVVTATPFAWVDPASLPRRQWLYGRHLVRGYVSCTIAPGGYGKSSLIVAEALAMVAGRAVLNEETAGQLRVWQINLEDPEDELRRRFAAAAIHYRVGPEDIGNRLFLDSGRKVNIVIATETRNGIVVAVPVVEAIKAEIIDKAIDVLQIDPFVQCHGVSENDNQKIAAVVRQWAMIAEATGCAIELVHHARKGGAGQAFTVDDARGASALIAAVRAARVLNGMSKEEAERANVDNPTSYFNIANGKSNLAPRSDKATWRHIVGVPLGNGDTTFDPKGDYIGVVEPWSWPDPFAEVSLEEAKDVQLHIAKGEWRENPQSTTWAGIVVAEILGFDLSDKAAKAAIRNLIAGWLSSGALRVVSRKDDKRMARKFIEVGQWVT